MSDFIKYLEDQRILFDKIADDTVSIDDKIYRYIQSTRSHFDDEFNLIHNGDGYDFHVIEFGGRYYYIECGTEESVELNELKYVGKNDFGFETKCFLGVHGDYEILSGTRRYSDWCKKAKWMGIEHLGIAERNTLAGTLKFQSECLKNDLRPVIGATFSVELPNGNVSDIKFYVKNGIGWVNLLDINHKKNALGKLEMADVISLSDGLVIVVDPKSISFEDSFPLDFHDDIYYQLDVAPYEDDRLDIEHLERIKEFMQSHIEPVSITDAYYLDKGDVIVKKIVERIGGTFNDSMYDQYLKSKEDYYFELSQFFEDDDKLNDIFLKAVDNEIKIAKECSFNIETGKRHLPRYEMTPEEKEKFGDNKEMFWSLIESGLEKLYPNYTDEHINRIEHEVKVLEMGDVIDYFLTTRDIINAATKQGILTGLARGSAGGSIVSYLLGIIKIDPLKFDLLFERFLNEGRVGEKVECEIIEIEGDDGTKKTIYPESILTVERDGKQTRIFGSDLKEGDVLI